VHARDDLMLRCIRLDACVTTARSALAEVDPSPVERPLWRLSRSQASSAIAMSWRMRPNAVPLRPFEVEPDMTTNSFDRCLSPSI
jgi:hypothetical protein